MSSPFERRCSKSQQVLPRLSGILSRRSSNLCQDSWNVYATCATHWTAMVTVLEVTPLMLKLTGTASPTGAVSGTCTLA